jgi:xanthine dehydrogenase accessory factor
MEILQHITEFCDSGRSFAVLLVLKTEGSTPRREGVRAIVDETGRIRGTIGGGAVEAEAQRLAVESIQSGQPVVFDFELEGAEAADTEPICGGRMRILVDPTAANDRAAYAEAVEALEQRKRGVLLTRVHLSDKTNVTVQWMPEAEIPGAAGLPGAQAIGDCLARQSPRLFVEEVRITATRVEVLVEPLIPNPLLVIVGGGHIGQALAHQAAPVGFDVAVIDDRPEFTDAALFPERAATRCGDIASEVADFPIAADTYVVIVTRGHRHDAEALEACIHRPAAYIGMIGSRRKVAMMRRDFIESGRATAGEFDRVFAPIGLDIGAVTVPEIAASIAAQLVAIRRKGRDYGRTEDMKVQ